MRILFFTHYFPPEGNAPASRVFEMARCWVQAGHRVTVVTCAPNAPDGRIYSGYRNRFRQWEEMEGIDVLRVWTFIAANKGTVRRMLNYITYGISALLHSLTAGKPDLIIATSPQIFTGWAGLFAHRLMGRPFVLEVRDMWAESITTLTSVEGSRVLRLIEKIEFGLYRAASRIVTVGDGYKKRLVERGLPPAKISIFTNGVDTEFFKPRPPDDALQKQWGLEGKFVCSYVGTIGMACQLDVTLRAGARLKEMGRDDIAFLLVGDGAVREELEAEAARMGLDNVIFTGKQPKAMMPRFHAISNCSLIHLKKTPLYTAVLPSKMFEMSYMKRPIILGVEGEAARVLDASGGGICIEPENEEALLAAIDRLQSNPSLAAQFGQSGHDYVAKHYDRETVARRYLDYLEGIISP